METLELRLETASSKTGLRLPFIMAATGKVPVMVVDDGGPNFTAATNGAWIKFGREWCEKACDDNDKLFGLMLHERMHILFMHMFRRDGRDPGLWNTANDAIINRNIKDMGYSLPEGGVDIDWVRADMSSEEVYDQLKKEQPPPPPNGRGRNAAPLRSPAGSRGSGNCSGR